MTTQIKFNRPKILRKKSIKVLEYHQVKWNGEKFYTDPLYRNKVYYMILLIQREEMSGPEMIFITSDEYYSFYNTCAKEGRFTHDISISQNICNDRTVTHKARSILCEFAKEKFPQMFK